MLESLPVALIVGTVLGFLTGLGVGGGSLLILWLTLALEMPQTAARGINLLYFLPTAGVGLLFHRKSGLLDRAALRQAVPWGLLTAAGGAWLSAAVDTALLRKPFGVYLLVTGVMLLVKRPEKKE